MKITKIFLIFSLFLIILLGGFTFGYLKGVDEENKIKVDTLKNAINEENYNDINIQYIISFDNNDDIEKAYEKLPKDLLNANDEVLKEYITNKHPDWKVNEIKRVRDDIIVVHTTKINYSKINNYEYKYKVGVYKGEIVIYKLFENGDEVIYKHTYRSIDTIKEEDKDIFLKGKIFDTKEEMTDFIENYIS